jgi:hypothetical protein
MPDILGATTLGSDQMLSPEQPNSAKNLRIARRVHSEKHLWLLPKRTNMKTGSQAASIFVSLLIAFGSSIVAAKAQSLTSAQQPSTELGSLTKALTGKWLLNVRFERRTLAPNGLANTGEETWRPGPGGFTLLEDEKLPTPAGDVFLLGVIWWDNSTRKLQGMECNSNLPYTCDLKGALNDITMTWDGKQFAIQEQETHNGKKSVWHEVWSDITARSFTQTGESEEPDGTRKRLFTIHATKVSDAGR